jgi:hypothetical protein
MLLRSLLTYVCIWHFCIGLIIFSKESLCLPIHVFPLWLGGGKGFSSSNLCQYRSTYSPNQPHSSSSSTAPTFSSSHLGRVCWVWTRPSQASLFQFDPLHSLPSRLDSSQEKKSSSPSIVCVCVPRQEFFTYTI